MPSEAERYQRALARAETFREVAGMVTQIAEAVEVVQARIGIPRHRATLTLESLDSFVALLEERSATADLLARTIDVGQRVEDASRQVEAHRSRGSSRPPA